MYIPQFKGPIEGYVVNQINRDHWRLRETHDREEMMQEAWVVFLRCAEKYPALDDAAHFMALFKTAWKRRVNTLSSKTTKVRAEKPMFDGDFDEAWQRPQEPIGETDNAGMLRIMVAQAPREVVMVLNLIMNAPQELLDLAAEAWKRSKKRGGEAAFLAQCLGLPPGSDPVGEVERYFIDAENNRN